MRKKKWERDAYIYPTARPRATGSFLDGRVPPESGGHKRASSPRQTESRGTGGCTSLVRSQRGARGCTSNLCVCVHVHETK